MLFRSKTVIFVNGCFWHGHECCRYFVVPKSNTEFWVNKINRNKERDKQKTALLEGMGWNVIVLWECQLKKSTKDATLSELLLKLTCKSG